jgi:hypothetical protein
MVGANVFVDPSCAENTRKSFIGHANEREGLIIPKLDIIFGLIFFD